MSESYQQLLDATIQHLQGLKAEGQKYVTVSPETLKALSAPVARTTKAAPRASPAPGPMSTPVAPRASAAPAPRPAASPEPPANPPVRPVEKSQPVPPVHPLSRDDKEKAMTELRDRALVCVKCPNLAASRKQVVFGVGDIHSPLMFIGEAPGAEEDVQGEPFVGAAGQLLTRVIQTMGLSRQTVYIANVLKCRPDTPGQTAGNRTPTATEMATCSPYLLAQIDLIQPKVIVALGGTAVEGLLGLKGITKLRGNWQTFRNTPLMPTYHPSYLLRTNSLRDKRMVWEDMLAVMEKLGMPINDKQRGFFLKG